MAKEIEYKFLVSDKDILSKVLFYDPTEIIQGYFTETTSPTAIRVRIKKDKGYITIKNGVGLECDEFEYEIPLEDAKKMMTFCGQRVIHKTRYHVPHGEHTIELDIFHGKHDGLIIAEIEVPNADTRIMPLEWLGEDVSEDYRYSNAYLSAQN